MDEQGPDETVSPTYLFDATTRIGIKPQEVIQGYDDWSKDSQYDKVIR